MPTEISWCGQTSLLLKYWKFFSPLLLYLKKYKTFQILESLLGIQKPKNHFQFGQSLVYGCIYSKRLRKSGQNSLKNFLRVPSGLQSWAQTLNKSQLMKMNQVVMVIPCIALWCHTASAKHLNWSGESWREAATVPRTWLAHLPRPARALTNTFQVGKCVITQGKLPGAYHH